MDELQKFENWINENCYMNGGRLQVYGTIRGDVATYYKENQAKNNEVLDLVSGCLICIMDNVEGEGLTKGMGYKILAEKEGMYCIVDDNNNLGVYGEIFFDKE